MKSKILGLLATLALIPSVSFAIPIAAIDLVKFINGQDSSTAPGVLVTAGEVLFGGVDRAQ